MDPNTRKSSKEDACLFLPHLVFSSLYTHYPEQFEKLFCFKEAQAFWKGVEKSKDPRLLPPLALGKRVVQPAFTCPIYVHGDGVEFQSRDSLMTWSWGSMLSKASALHQHILLTAFAKSVTVGSTWTPLNDWVSWSFDALIKGKRPSQDPYGSALPQHLEELAGQPLTAAHHRAFIFAIQGDLEFCSNSLGMPHWQNKYPCAECDAQRPTFKGIKCPEGKSVKELKEEHQDFVYVTPEQALLDKRSGLHPLFDAQGINTALVRGDSLHIVHSRGVASHLAGSLLHYLRFFDGVGARQRTAPAQRLQRIFARIKELYKEHGVTSRLTNLRLSKAGETKHFLPPLLQVVREALDDEEPIHQTMISCLEAMVKIDAHYDSIGIFPTSSEFGEACNLAKRFFSTYADLHQWALLKGRKIFHITHKFHSYMHLIHNSQYLNYRIHHNYRAEHFVGQLSVLAHSISFGVKTSKLCVKMGAKHRVLMHMQLSHPGFGKVEENTSDP